MFQSSRLVPMGLRFLLFSFFLCFTACTGQKEVDPIRWNEDACENCHMKINDRKFGAEVITNHGRIYKFDAMECLMDFVKKNESILEQIFVVDYFRSELIPVQDASFVRSTKIHGPMGTHVFATKDHQALKAYLQKDPAVEMNWDTLKKETQ